MAEHLTDDEKRLLLRLARTALENGVRGENLPPLDPSTLTPALQAHGASFVTLTIDGQLRGCIGALEPYQPLAEDVQEHAVAAALHDPRFPPVTPAELPHIQIEISHLTRPRLLPYTDADDLLSKLNPGLDGVILRDGYLRATFLPQVWAQLPEKETFLSHLCRKMGAPPDLWRKKHLQVEIYRVEEFHEK